MSEQDWLAERFEEHRTRLRAVAYRMLGSLSEADDAVQEAWLRLSVADTSGVDDLGAWLRTVVARICLNVLRSRSARREEPIGPHLPDPIVSAADSLGYTVRRALVNGGPGVVTFAGTDPFAVLGFTVAREKIVEMNILADPERLRRLDLIGLER